MEKQGITKMKRILLVRTITTGFFGGLFTGIFFLLMYFFNMNEIDPIMILQLFFKSGGWLEKWYAYIVFLLLISVASMLIALLYYFLFKTKKSWVSGALYGVAIWLIFYLILPILLKNYNPFTHLQSESHVAMVCLFILYGTFTGYSISFDYENIKEEFK